MTWDIERIASILRATIEPPEDDEQRPVWHRLHFHDGRLKYVLNLMPQTCCVISLLIQMNLNRVVQCSEYGFTCTDIEVGASAYREK